MVLYHGVSGSGVGGGFFTGGRAVVVVVVLVGAPLVELVGALVVVLVAGELVDGGGVVVVDGMIGRALIFNTNVSVEIKVLEPSCVAQWYVCVPAVRLFNTIVDSFER